MGTTQTRYLYEFKLKDELKDVDKFDLKETNYKATFADNLRSIIKETDKKVNYIGNIDNDKKCVAKVYKNINRNITYTISDLIDDLTNLFKAKNLTLIYNKKYRNVTDFIHINYVDFYIGYNKKIDSKQLKNLLMNKNPKDLNIDNINLIENYIDSKYFRIFVDEYCHVRYKDFKSIPWFMHWNWVETNGTYLICDLRGEITFEDELQLSSPSLQSKEGSYGNSDNGIYALITFLAEHKHTEHCQDLPWPKNEYIEKAKNLKEKCTSPYKCDGCEETYDEIISSVFNSKNYSNNTSYSKFNYLYVLIPIIIFLVIGMVILFFYFIKRRKRSNAKEYLKNSIKEMNNMNEMKFIDN